MREPYSLTIEQIASLTDFQKVYLLSEQDDAALNTMPEEIPLEVTHYQCCKAMGMSDEAIAARWEEVRHDWEA